MVNGGLEARLASILDDEGPGAAEGAEVPVIVESDLDDAEGAAANAAFD